MVFVHLPSHSHPPDPRASYPTTALIDKYALFVKKP